MNSASSPSDGLQTIRKLIENGHIQNAITDLDALDLKHLRRSHLLVAAHLYRRCGRHLKTIELLRPFVRPGSKILNTASDPEKLEYAVALTGLGSTIEARDLLEEVEDKNLNLYLLYTAFNQIRQWNYAEAIDPLEKYIEREQDTYAKSVAQVNLLQAYLSCGNLESARDLIDDHIWQKELADQKKLRLLGNIEELKAQYFFQTKSWAEALGCLESAQPFLEKSELDNLFVQKWKFLVNLFSRESGANSHEEWLKLRNIAQTMGHRETIRDLDFHYGFRTRQVNILKHVYWGTPFLSYKNRINKGFKTEFGLDLTHDETFCRTLAPADSLESFDIVEPLKLTLHESNVSPDPISEGVKPGTLLQKLFCVLNSDYYQGMSIYAIHETVYTGEYFNPASSPEKVRQIIHRLRDWFKSIDAPLNIDLEGNHYHLHAQSSANSIGIACYNKSLVTQRAPSIVFQIREHFLSETFKLKDLSKFLGMPSRTLSNQIKKAIELDFVEKLGAGPRAQYRLKP